MNDLDVKSNPLTLNAGSQFIFSRTYLEIIIHTKFLKPTSIFKLKRLIAQHRSKFAYSQRSAYAGHGCSSHWCLHVGYAVQLCFKFME